MRAIYFYLFINYYERDQIEAEEWVKVKEECPNLVSKRVYLLLKLESILFSYI